MFVLVNLPGEVMSPKHFSQPQGLAMWWYSAMTRPQHTGQLSCHATGKHKRHKTGSQVHPHERHCLQPKKIIEVGKP